jgi:hypothetical protein
MAQDLTFEEEKSSYPDNKKEPIATNSSDEDITSFTDLIAEGEYISSETSNLLSSELISTKSYSCY